MDARTEPSAPPTAATAAHSKARATGRRRRLFLLLAVGVALAGVAFGLYWLLVASHHAVTDDAYVQADVAQVTPLVSGSIIAAPVSDTAPVRKGDVLVVIDPADYRLALDQAQ